MNLCLVCQEPNPPELQYCSHCGVELPELPRSREGHLPRGVMLERRYEIGRVLGSGGFANAYLATDSRLNRACVVKEMLRPLSASAQEIRELERNFSREVQALVALNQPGHPNIPEIYDHFSSGSGNYLVMKYIEGQNLEDMLDRSGVLIWQEAVKIAIAVCDALLYMHSRQPPVLHRDIKPANILIDESGRIWLVDFGLSKALPTKSHGKSGTTALGTAGYTPLEQWMEMAVPTSDIYALGATLHHLLTGHDPRDAFPIQPDLPKIRQEHGNFLPIRHVDRSLPEELEALVSRAVNRLATRRPIAEQFKHSLEELLAVAKALPPFDFRDGKEALVSHAVDRSATRRPTAELFKQTLEELLIPATLAKAPPPFYFRYGQMANDPKELVALSLAHWEEARDDLYNGASQALLVKQERYELESQIQNLLLKEQSPDIALDKFLRLLDPNLRPPRVKFTTEGTNFGRYNLVSSIRLSAKVKVTNYGPGCFYGTSHLQQDWLKVYPQEFALPPNESQVFSIRVQHGHLVLNTTYQNELTIDSNSEQKQFSLSLHTSPGISTGFARFAVLLGFIIYGVIVLCLNDFSNNDLTKQMGKIVIAVILVSYLGFLYDYFDNNKPDNR